MPPTGRPGNFGVPSSKGPTEFKRFRSEIKQNLLANETTYVTRAPTILPRQYRPPRPSTEPTPNLLLTLLAATAAATPFEPTDWTPELPPSRIKPVDLVQNLLLTLYPTTLAPFINEEWPTPRYTVSRAIESAAVNQNLYLPLGRPFVTNNWPAIPRRTSPVTEAAQNLLLTTLAVAPATAPFVPMDWTVPPAKLTKQSEVAQNLLLTLLPTTLAPFIYEEWPASPARRVSVTEAAQNLLLTALAPTAQAAPFVPMDWTVVPARPSKSSETTPNLLLTLLPTTLAPFIPEEWVVSTTRPTRSTEAGTNLLTTTLAPSVQAAPFVPFDWTVLPRTLARTSEWSQNAALTLLPTTARPFVSYDWTPPPRDRAPHIAVIEQNNQSLANIPPTPNLHRLFIDVESGDIYYRLNATTPLILRVG